MTQFNKPPSRKEVRKLRKARGLTDHHRRPRSIEGSKTDLRNRNDVPKQVHPVWHALVSNYCARQQEILFNKLLKDSGCRVALCHRCDPIHTDECPPKKCCIKDFVRRPVTDEYLVRRWQKLIELIGLQLGYEPTLRVVFHYINDELLDADYMFRLEKI